MTITMTVDELTEIIKSVADSIKKDVFAKTERQPKALEGCYHVVNNLVHRAAGLGIDKLTSKDLAPLLKLMDEAYPIRTLTIDWRDHIPEKIEVLCGRKKPASNQGDVQ